jgi:hypothetical protein
MAAPASTDNVPSGTTSEAEDIFLEGGAEVYFGGVRQHSPDDNGWYWGVTGVVGNPVYHAGCYENLQLSDNMQVSDIRCDTVGMTGQTVRRNFLELTLDVKALFPLSQLRYMLRWSDAESVPADEVEYAGIGQVNQQEYYIIYLARVYDEATDDWVSITLHRAQFEHAGALQMRYGEEWVVGIRIRAFADDSLPSEQQFATVVRYDPSVI